MALRRRAAGEEGAGDVEGYQKAEVLSATLLHDTATAVIYPIAGRCLS